MALTQWLSDALEASPMTEEARDYLMGRGATDELIKEWGIKVFDPPLTPCPDESIHKYYDAHFERFEGKVIYPLYSPHGKLLGFDSRNVDQKDDVRFLLPESRWNPIWVGMPGAMEAIWNGADIIIVEGRFDVMAMMRVLQIKKSDKICLGSGPAHLSWKQVEWLRRWCKGHVYMAYDNDSTGKQGIEDAIKHLSRREIGCSHLRYGETGDDPGAIWDRGGDQGLDQAFPYL